MDCIPTWRDLSGSIRLLAVFRILTVLNLFNLFIYLFIAFWNFCIYIVIFRFVEVVLVKVLTRKLRDTRGTARDTR